MSRYIPTKRRQHILGHVQVPNQISVYFHLNNILGIKDALGSNCTSVSHVEYPKYELQEVLNEEGEVKEGILKRVKVESQHGVVAKFKKQEGKAIKPILAILNGTPTDIKGEYYAQLKNDMTDAAREKGLL